MTPVSFAEAFFEGGFGVEGELSLAETGPSATGIASLFFDESPLPTLTASARASSSRDSLGGGRARRNGSSQRRKRLPAGVSGTEELAVPADALRVSGLFVRTPSAVARSRRASRQVHTGQSSASARGLDLSAVNNTSRQQFFDLYRAKSRECFEEGDFAIQPDSARNTYLQCSMPLTAIPVVSLTVRIEGLVRVDRGSTNAHMYNHARTRSLQIAIDANDTVRALKAAIRDRTRVSLADQRLAFEDTELEDVRTLASYRIHKARMPIVVAHIIAAPLLSSPDDDVSTAAELDDTADAGGAAGNDDVEHPQTVAMMHDSLLEAMATNEPLARAIRQRATTAVECTNPATGQSRKYDIGIIPLPIMTRNSTEETRRLLVEYIPEMEDDELYRACKDAGLVMKRDPSMEALRVALTQHYMRPATKFGAAETEDTPGKMVVNLNGMRLGDKYAIAYTQGLQKLTDQGVAVSEIHLRENWLGPEGAKALATVMGRCDGLEFIDMSENKIGRAGARAVGEVMQNNTQLKSLILENSGFQNYAVVDILTQVSTHKSITALDLSGNGIGGPKSSDALRECLERNKTLKDLDFAWNNLSPPFASPALRPLATNSRLERLDLEWNAIGDAGGMNLGAALRHNTGLTYLNISHNSINEKGTMVIADAMKENKTLQELYLSENPIGIRGGRAVLRTLRTLATYPKDYRKVELLINISKCNMKVESSEALFDPLEPGG